MGKEISKKNIGKVENNNDLENAGENNPELSDEDMTKVAGGRRPPAIPFLMKYAYKKKKPFFQ